MTQEALKLALEALESSDKLINGSGNHFGLEGAMDGYYSGCFDVGGNNKLLNKAITAIKEALAQEQECWCTTCRPITMADMRFVVCPDCDNKRCPKANDHRNACTNSNEVGQKGSSWEHVKPLAQPEQEPFFTEANGFPQEFVSKDRQKQAIISMTEQCAALVWERDELQKQVWLYEKNGVTCQTYRHKVEQSCSECNVQMNYTTPPQQEPVVGITAIRTWFKDGRVVTQTLCNSWVDTTPPQPEQEPVAWMSEHRFDELRQGFTVMTTLTKQRAFDDDVALYTTPPQRTWVGLTDEQITQVIKSMPRGIKGWMSDWDLYEFSKAIEAKLKENT